MNSSNLESVDISQMVVTKNSFLMIHAMYHHFLLTPSIMKVHPSYSIEYFQLDWFEIISFVCFIKIDYIEIGFYNFNN